MSEIYEPQEDSYLMSEVLKTELPKLIKQNPKLKFLEVGCGSGINLRTALDIGVKKNNVLGADVNSKAVKHCRGLGLKVIQSNLFNGINGKYGKFDVISFNPPYLPFDKREPRDSRIATTGGKKGNELTLRFLKQAKIYLNKKGRIFLVTSSLAEKVDFDKLGYCPKILSEKKLFFEKLFCWELILTNQ